MDPPSARRTAILPGFAARVTALPQRLTALPQRRQEQVLDAGIGLSLAAVNVVSLLPYRAQLHPLWLALVLVAAQGVPLAWRRAGPIGVGFVVAAARVAYDRIGFGFAPFPLGPAIAVYTIVDRRGPMWRWMTFVLLVVGIAISETSPGGRNEPYDAIFQALIFLTAWIAGMVSRTKRASLQAARDQADRAQDRADRAEAEVDRQTALAAAAERARIARELHDVVAHHVSLIAVQAEAVASLLPGRPEQARRSAEIIGDTARQALTELRRLLGVLRGPADRAQTAPSASLADLSAVLDQVRDAGLAVQFDIVGTPYPLAPSIDLTAYRIVQEALTNTLRHTGASQAEVTLRYEPDHITVRVTDSGQAGQRPDVRAQHTGTKHTGAQHTGAGSGFGLAGIAERVASCGGSLTVGPTPPSGFAVAATLPAR